MSIWKFCHESGLKSFFLIIRQSSSLMAKVPTEVIVIHIKISWISKAKFLMRPFSCKNHCIKMFYVIILLFVFIFTHPPIKWQEPFPTEKPLAQVQLQALWRATISFFLDSSIFPCLDNSIIISPNWHAVRSSVCHSLVHSL